MSLGTRNPNDPIGSGSMDSCNHDKRFAGVFDLPRDCHGCLACYAEKLAAEVKAVCRERDKINETGVRRAQRMQTEIDDLKEKL